MAKKGIVMGDIHGGSMVGLTPPAYSHYGNSERVWKTKALREEMWAAYLDIIREIGPVDFAIHNGDAVDGMQRKQKRTDLVTNDWEEQCNIALLAIERIQTRNYYLTAGTDYHTMDADGGDVEKRIADDLGGVFKSHLFLNVEGVKLNVKHHIGASSIKHLRFTALPRERMHNIDWAIEGVQPLADLYFRSHVHYCVGVHGYDRGSKWEAISLPALQNLGGKFGSRRCGGVVHWGLMEVRIDGKEWQCIPHIRILNAAKSLSLTVS